MLLLLKLTLVPLCIAGITLAGRRWGSALAGLLGGCPIVGGPIVIFIAAEQGLAFGAQAATAALYAVVCLLAYGTAYAWASLRWPWPGTLAIGLVIWFLAAAAMTRLPQAPWAATLAALLALLILPALQPRVPASTRAPTRSIRDLPYRMLTATLLTLAVTGAASMLGAVWSGMLAAFPIVSLTLAVFTHAFQGSAQVVAMFHGMTRGLGSFTAFFLVLALAWPALNLWQGSLLAIAVALSMQLVLRAIAHWRMAGRRSVERGV
ncbi:hypothetical protein D8I35_14490 [Corticibacter populi]|uniref:Uncharacterized protein n=1 Tax=Corticibacter populi TaxID=1550736 RepID=A0A3M6QPT2_9BURK|nr:hypothetical protein [Corticibacter populi]RMX05048.1 hypothetical protein D8I35_14490 [Corticibacter populi]RZS33513.1 hypothetical protein EV687_1837 [Corticibacter populi]